MNDDSTSTRGAGTSGGPASSQNNGTAGPQAAHALPAESPTVTLGQPPPTLDMGGVGEIERLSDSEYAAFQSCEMVISMGWSAFVDVGLALAQIRDQRLYRIDYDNFEAYCRDRWEYGRHYANRLVAAAQTFRLLVTNCHQTQTKPEHEGQIRPLIGLPPEMAGAAWTKAVELAAGHRVRGRLVRSVVRNLVPSAPQPAMTKAPRLRKKERRKQIDNAVGELLILVMQRASYDLLTQKIQALHTALHGIWAR